MPLQHAISLLFLLTKTDDILFSSVISLTNHFSALERNMSRDRKCSFQDMFLEYSNSRGLERHLCCDHEVQEHTKSPDIYWCPQVHLISEQLRCCIWRGPTECVQLLSTTWTYKQLLNIHITWYDMVCTIQGILYDLVCIAQHITVCYLVCL